MLCKKASDSWVCAANALKSKLICNLFLFDYKKQNTRVF